MPKELLIYGGINTASAADFINQVTEVGDEELVIRMNTPGGNPEAGFGMIAKIQERTAKTTLKIDGSAYSMGLFMAAYADNVEALDTSEFLFHRAAYPDWYEAEYMSEAESENLGRINKSLETAFRNSIDVSKFEQMKGTSVKNVFSMDSREDVFLSAKEAQLIGLVNKIVKITPQKRTELNSMAARISADTNTQIKEIPLSKVKEAVGVPPVKTNTKNMTREELESKHPALFASVFAEGQTAGTEIEATRVKTWQVFADADPKAVSEGIKSGKALDPVSMAELTLKGATANMEAAKLKAETATTVTTNEATATEITEESAVQEKINASLVAAGLKTVKK